MRSAGRAFVVGVVSIFVSCPLALAHDLRLSASSEPTGDVTKFSCDDAVYVHVTWSPAPTERQSVRATWRNVSSGLTETTEIKTSPGTPRSWMWLRFGARSNGFRRLLSPEGLSRTLGGPWSVEVAVESEIIGTRTFDVEC